MGGNATLPFAGGAPYRVCIKMDGTDVMGGAKCERVVLCDLECVLRDEADKVQSPDACLPSLRGVGHSKGGLPLHGAGTHPLLHQFAAKPASTARRKERLRADMIKGGYNMALTSAPVCCLGRSRGRSTCARM